jgi:hypothetical protein
LRLDSHGNRFLQNASLTEADRGRRFHWGLPSAVALLAAWGAWCALAHVTLYEVTGNARLEVDGAIYPIQ